jgi:putative ABC transport system permease protein
MIVLAMALGVSLATAMLNVMLDVGDKVSQELRTYGANLTVVPRGTSLVNELYDTDEGSAGPRKYLPESELPKMKMIFWAFNIVDFAPFLDVKVSLSSHVSSGHSATLVGTWFDKKLELPAGESVETGMKRLKSWWDLEGSWPEDDDLQGAMAGKGAAEKLGLKVGDSFRVEALGATSPSSLTLTVKALFHSGGPEDEQIFVPLKLAQALSGRPGMVERVDVSALTTPENELSRRAAQDPRSLSRKEWDTWYCTAYISSIAYQIEEVIPDSRAKAILQVSDSEGAILRKTQLLMLLLTVLSLACSALAISSLVMAGVMERSSEIGLLKAIGATGFSVVLFHLAETALTALAGGVIGYFAGLGFAQIVGWTVFGSAVAVKLLVIPMVILLVLIVTLTGCLPAMRMLLSLRPTEVLHGR